MDILLKPQTCITWIPIGEEVLQPKMCIAWIPRGIECLRPQLYGTIIPASKHRETVSVDTKRQVAETAEARADSQRQVCSTSRIAADTRRTITSSAIDWTSANRDPDVFDDPDVYNPAGNAERNLVYGTGPHACPGRPLATLELRVLLRALLARFTVSAAPCGRAQRAEWPLGGWERVPIVLNERRP